MTLDLSHKAFQLACKAVLSCVDAVSFLGGELRFVFGSLCNCHLTPLALLSFADLTVFFAMNWWCRDLQCLIIITRWYPVGSYRSNDWKFHLVYLMAFVYTSAVTISPPPLCPRSCLPPYLPSRVLFLFLCFRLTHSLTLMHASLLENGYTSLPGESFMHSSAWFPLDL